MNTPISNINKDLTDAEVDIIDYLRIIGKHKVFMLIFISLCTAIGFLNAVTAKPWYYAETTIMPIDSGGGSGSELSGFAQLAGISLPSKSGSCTVAILFRSISAICDVYACASTQSDDKSASFTIVLPSIT
jgi:hypothetical protein